MPGRPIETVSTRLWTCPLPARVQNTHIHGRPRAAPTDTDYYSYFHTMARRLELPFWVVLGRGSYTSPITAPVSEVVATVQAALVAAIAEGRSARRVES